MRCSEVARELAVPTGEISREDLAAHLRDCGGCSARAEAERSFDGLWAANRPPVPSDRVRDAMWARIEEARSADLEPTVTIRQGFRWRTPVWMSAAAAALIGLGAWMWVQKDPAQGGAELAEGSKPVSAPMVRIDVPVGQTVLYSLDDGEMRVVQGEGPGEPSDDSMAMYGPDGELQFYGPDDFLAFYGVAEFLPDVVASNNATSPAGE